MIDNLAAIGYGLIGLLVGIPLAIGVEWLSHEETRRPGRADLISWWTLAVMLTTSLLFGVTWLRIPPRPYLLLVTVYVCALVVVLFVDLRERRIPNVITYPAIALALVASPFVPGLGLARSLVGGGLSLVLFLTIYALAGPFAARWARVQGREAPAVPFGFGDVKLGLFIGLITGFPAVFPALFIGSLVLGALALVVLVARLVVRGRQAFLSTIPFGPALVIGGLVGLLWGQDIVQRLYVYERALGIAAGYIDTYSAALGTLLRTI